MAWAQQHISVPQKLWLRSSLSLSGPGPRSTPCDGGWRLARRLEDGVLSENVSSASTDTKKLLQEHRSRTAENHVLRQRPQCRLNPKLVLPGKEPGCFSSIYNRLFIIILALNIIVVVIYLSHALQLTDSGDSQTATFDRVSSTCKIAFASNLCASILVRHDHFINFLYRCLVVHARRAPLVVRRRLAGVYNMGGVHSGCATASILWYITCTGIDISQSDLTSGIGQARAIIPLLVLSTLLSIIMSSLPYVRVHHHNLFELMHRFGGWLALALLWVQMVLPPIDTDTDRQNSSTVDPNRLWSDPSLWLLTVSTVLIIYPWIRLRRLQIDTRPMSDHAVELSFPLRIRPCRTVRVSRSPLIESHSFAAIPDPANPTHSAIIVSRAGDWTSAVIDQPPERLWLRETATWGVIRVATLFKSCTIIATGSGIGPCLSLFIGHPGLPCRILWSTKSAVKTYGQAVVDTVMRTDPQAYITDTSKAGRIDMLQAALSFQLMAESEAVIVISNTLLTRKVVTAFLQRGIPAYGPIWDS